MKNLSRAVVIIFVIVLVITFTLALPSCDRGGGNTGTSPVTGAPDDPDERSNDSLYALDGWWARPEGYEAEGFSLVDYFMIDAQAGTWTIYNEYAVEYGTYDCYLSGDRLILNYEGLGDVEFYYDGYALLDDEDNVHFVPSGPIVAPDAAGFEGRWYYNGDTDSNFYLIDGETYEFYEVWYSADEPYKTGTWELSNMTRLLENGSIQQLQITFVDEEDFFGGRDLPFDDDQVAMFDAFSKVFYLHEDAIGTYQGDTLITTFRIAFNFWEGPEFGDPYLMFRYYEKEFSIVVYDSEGNGEIEYQGTWSVDGTEITLMFEDGYVEAFELDGDSFYLDYYDMTFKDDVW